MKSARNKLIAKADHIRTLKWLVIGLTVAIIGQWFRIGHLQDVRRVFIPPDLSKGFATQFEVVPPPVAYTFAYYIYQQLNRWKKNGYEDYQNNIYRLQGFFTPSCLAALEEDMNDKNRRGELLNRIRVFQEIPGRGYVSDRVYKETQTSWMIWLDVNIRESIGGHDVKDVNVRYPLRVVLFDVDKEVNPWGLGIACQSPLNPALLSDEQLQKPFRRPGGYP